TSGTVTGDNFTNFALFSVSGHKYADANGNGTVDSGDVGLSGVTILSDMDYSGTLNSGDISAVTDGTGSYSFTGLGVSALSKHVLAVLPPRYAAPCTYTTLFRSTSGTVTGDNFTNFALFSVSGHKYADANGNGTVD